MLSFVLTGCSLDAPFNSFFTFTNKVWALSDPTYLIPFFVGLTRRSVLHMPLRQEWDMMGFTGLRSAGEKLEYRYVTKNFHLVFYAELDSFPDLFFCYRRVLSRSVVTYLLGVTMSLLHGPGLIYLLESAFFIFSIWALTLWYNACSDEHGDRPRPLPNIPELKMATELFERKESPSWNFDVSFVSLLSSHSLVPIRLDQIPNY